MNEFRQFMHDAFAHDHAKTHDREFVRLALSAIDRGLVIYINPYPKNGVGELSVTYDGLVKLNT